MTIFVKFNSQSQEETEGIISIMDSNESSWKRIFTLRFSQFKFFWNCTEITERGELLMILCQIMQKYSLSVTQIKNHSCFQLTAVMFPQLGPVTKSFPHYFSSEKIINRTFITNPVVTVSYRSLTFTCTSLPHNLKWVCPLWLKYFFVFQDIVRSCVNLHPYPSSVT